MKLNVIYNEPCLETMSKFPDKSIDCIVTSPPYWYKRDYKWDGQWGLEPTFELYLENLWSMMDQAYRILKDEGTAWINLGDTYGSFRGRSGASSDKIERDRCIDDTKHVRHKPNDIRKKYDKCLLLIPHRFAIGCIDRGWLVRNDIVWAKRNGMPESTKDRFSTKHEYVFLLSKQKKYYFDLDAIKDKTKRPGEKNSFAGKKGRNVVFEPGDPLYRGGAEQMGNTIVNGEYKNLGSVSDFWDIPTRPNRENHFASYNDKLIEKPIKAGCPVGGVVYDPFFGTGTTGEVCLRLNRNFIGSEGSANNVDISKKRLNPFMNRLRI